MELNRKKEKIELRSKGPYEGIQAANLNEFEMAKTGKLISSPKNASLILPDKNKDKVSSKDIADHDFYITKTDKIARKSGLTFVPQVLTPK